MRPIDISRRLNISTTTLRNYEDMDMIPNVTRTASGYRIYSEEHFAYFICIREMLGGFRLAFISKVLKEVIAKKINSALWMVNQTQAELNREKIISKKISLNLLCKAVRPISTRQERLTINDVSRESGIPVTTIRYWDKIGLLSAKRCVGNNYRIFTSEHIRQALIIYALKLSFHANGQKHYIDKIKEGLVDFDYNDKSKIKDMTKGIEQYLDQTNRDQIRGISALYRLCVQVESNHFDNQI
ncbi:MAG: MerR family DNA-binding transcriptional regulator [Herbinix sp.]|nr:MerR family DNA-binding transcriptional regulator [Herbinix sp.]